MKWVKANSVAVEKYLAVDWKLMSFVLLVKH